MSGGQSCAQVILLLCSLSMQICAAPITSAQQEVLSDLAELQKTLSDVERGQFVVTDYIKSKRWPLQVIETMIPRHASGFLAPHSTILDVGAGSGELARYLSDKYDVHIRALDVAAPSENVWANDLPQQFNFPVEKFDGSSLQAVQSKSVDTALFVFSLHHAAANAPNLLAEAARVAKKWVVVLEDLDIHADWASKRHVAHDPKGIFLDQQQWIELFTKNGMKVVAQGTVGKPGSNKEKFQHYFVCSLAPTPQLVPKTAEPPSPVHVSSHLPRTTKLKRKQQAAPQDNKPSDHFIM